MSEMQAIFQNHDVVENWDDDIEVLHSISTAFQNRDLSELNKLLQTISFYEKIMTVFFMHKILPFSEMK